MARFNATKYIQVDDIKDNALKSIKIMMGYVFLSEGNRANYSLPTVDLAIPQSNLKLSFSFLLLR
jgi:hypothetical protein